MFAYRSILREPPRPTVVRENSRAPWLAVSVVCFGAFMGQLDASIVAITFPAMQREFGAPVAAVQWVSLSYLLGLIAMLAPAGASAMPSAASSCTPTASLLSRRLPQPAGWRPRSGPW